MAENRHRREAEIAALSAGIEVGLSLVDTAEMYADGEAELLVGEAVAGRRDDVFLVNKVLPSNATYDGTLEACRSLPAAALSSTTRDALTRVSGLPEPGKQSFPALPELGGNGLELLGLRDDRGTVRAVHRALVRQLGAHLLRLPEQLGQLGLHSAELDT
ncbi:MAG: oxidoreductase [Marmoricola sp.]|jgi:hypothetical protein|nr:oxidoreductase [Marmoricola sp.]